MSKTDNHNKMYINAKGERVMRITEVIKILAKDQLITWANMLGFKHIDYRKELDRTANIGTMFHAVIEDYMSPNRLAVIDFEEYGVFGFQSQSEAMRAINSFFLWYDKNKHRYHVKFTEKVIVGEHLGGTIDCGIDGFDDPNKVIFVDYKTSGGFYMTMFLQLAGYVTIYEEVNGPDTVEGVMVILADKKNGDPARVRFISRKDLEPFIICFNHLYHTALATNMLNKSWYSLTSAVE